MCVCVCVYDQVPSNQALEPLFRFANREVLGMKFVDMLGVFVCLCVSVCVKFEGMNFVDMLGVCLCVKFEGHEVRMTYNIYIYIYIYIHTYIYIYVSVDTVGSNMT